MYKLRVISGPSAGKSFKLEEGQTSIGRQSDNLIHLNSRRISKQHCFLIVHGGSITIEDNQSSNGTFVNGVLTRRKTLSPGDRLSVGEYVLELYESRGMSSSPSSSRIADVIPISSHLPNSSSNLGENGSVGISTDSGGLRTQTAPSDLKGKALWYFEHYVMPFFYSFNLKYEWRSIGFAMFVALIASSLLISIYPLLSSSRASILKETAQRAVFMSRQIAETNAPFLAAGQETKTVIGLAEDDVGVRLAVLADLENRIIAPGAKMNQYLASGPEAEIAVRAADAFRNGREQGVTAELKNNTLIAIQPVKVYDSRIANNRVVAMAVVSIDTRLATPDIGTIGVVYFNALVMTFLVGGLLMLILYRLTLKRFELLNEDIDKVLRGEATKLTKDFKLSELNELWDVIDAALQRIPKGASDAAASFEMESRGIEDFMGSVQMISEAAPAAAVLAFDGDKKIVFLNSIFEEISGIRADASLGKDIQAVARDEALAALCEDMMEQAAQKIGQAILEDFDFGGVAYKIRLSAIGQNKIHGFLLFGVKEGT